jgi:hypothetical protein
MSVIKEPNYKHYSRLNTIFADEAQGLLARFELSVKDITDPGEYNKQLENEMMLAERVLYSAFDEPLPMLKFTCELNPYAYNMSGEKFFHLDIMRLNLAEFCIWASKKGYKLPKELAKLSTCSGSENEKIEPVVEVEIESLLPATEGNKNKGGKPKGALTESVELVYRELLKHGNIEVLRAGNARGFLDCLKRMSTQDYKNENKNLSEFLLERIKEVKVPKVGKCSITTHDRENITNSRKITTESKSYQLNEISKKLNKLRTT